MASPEEMATEVVKAWISGKTASAQLLGEELKKIYGAMIDAYYKANSRDQG